MRIRIVPATLVTLLLVGCGGSTTAPESTQTRLQRSGTATGNAGMVSSGHELATLAGVEVLEDGGNAFDAASPSPRP